MKKLLPALLVLLLALASCKKEGTPAPNSGSTTTKNGNYATTPDALVAVALCK